MSKREDILAASLDLIVESGLHAFSFSKLFARAGVGSGTVYHYFPSKEELVRSLYRETAALLDQAILSDYDATADLKTRFRLIMQKMAMFAIKNGKELELLNACNHSSYIPLELRQQATPALKLSLDLLAEGQATGQFVPMEPMMAVSMISGALLAVISGQQSGKFPSHVDQLDQTIEACWRAIAFPAAEA